MLLQQCRRSISEMVPVNPQVVGTVSPWVNPDSENPSLRADSAAALRQELDWGYHLGLQAVLLQPSITQRSVANTGRLVMQVCHPHNVVPNASDVSTIFHVRSLGPTAVAWFISPCFSHLQQLVRKSVLRALVRSSPLQCLLEYKKGLGRRNKTLQFPSQA